jgi:hypothetical protein
VWGRGRGRLAPRSSLSPDQTGTLVYEPLAVGHQYLGYLVFLLFVAAIVVATQRAKNGREYEPGIFALTALVVSVQLLFGILVYGAGQWWESDQPLVAYAHPLLMVAAVGLTHAGVARARREQMAVDAYLTARRFMIIAAVVLTAGIGVASVPA